MTLLLGRKQAAAYLSLPSGQKILDVATGSGVLAYELARRGYAVVGIDRSFDAIEQAKKTYDAGLDLLFIEGDATRLPFRDDAFDASCISFALHDMTYETQLAVLREMQRVTRQGGQLLIVDYANPARYWYTFLLTPVLRMVESARWSAFVRRGAKSLLQDIGLRSTRETRRFGLIQIIAAENAKVKTVAAVSRQP